jgi:hypothetical protein
MSPGPYNLLDARLPSRPIAVLCNRDVGIGDVRLTDSSVDERQKPQQTKPLLDGDGRGAHPQPIFYVPISLVKETIGDNVRLGAGFAVSTP